MKGLVGVILVILAIVIAVKLLGLALKIAGILIVVALAIGGYNLARRYLKGPGNA